MTAADDLVEQWPNVVPKSVCQPDPTTMQIEKQIAMQIATMHIDKGAVTSGRGQGKISSKRIMYAEIAWYKYYIQVYNTDLLFSFSQLYENMK